MTSPHRINPFSFSNNPSFSRVILALDEVQDPQNLGALLRTAYFLGCDRVVVSEKNTAPLSGVVSKASAGAMELIQVSAVKNMVSFLLDAKNQGWTVVGTESRSSGAVVMEKVPREKPIILLLGNEGHGIRTNLLRQCDHLVTVERAGNSDNAEEDHHRPLVDSLNVSVAGGILLHHFLNNK
jgi:21S rRNA (GM2251-2'-O)-methyltransferase